MQQLSLLAGPRCAVEASQRKCMHDYIISLHVMKYASVIVENKSKHTDMFFTYRKGDLELGIGDKVDVPFGTKEISGYVFGFTDDCEVLDEKLKDILRVSEYGSLNEEMIKTASWMRQRYAITYFDAINLFAAKGKPPKAGKEKEPYKELDVSYPKPEELTSEQKNALSKIERAIEDGKQESFLLHGVTSSGKTEVYLETISRCIEKGKTAIMLVPEISLTPMMMEYFIRRFKGNVAILHSELTPAEKYDEYLEQLVDIEMEYYQKYLIQLLTIILLGR